QAAECPLSDVVRRVAVAGRVLAVAEVDEHLRLGAAVTEITEQADRPLVAAAGLLVITKLVVGEAQAVPGDGLAVAVLQVLHQVERLPTAGEARAVITGLGVQPAGGIEGSCLPRPPPGPSGEAQSLLR